VDTSAWYALMSSDDRFHDSAISTFSELELSGELWTNSYVIVETLALLRRRRGFAFAKNFVDMIGNGVNVSWIGPDHHHRAWNSFSSRGGTGLSFIDWTVLLAARDNNSQVFTFDAGFAREGATVIPSLP
jgi:predicted nucleic acid-binding protein